MGFGEWIKHKLDDCSTGKEVSGECAVVCSSLQCRGF